MLKYWIYEVLSIILITVFLVAGHFEYKAAKHTLYCMYAYCERKRRKYD